MQNKIEEKSNSGWWFLVVALALLLGWYWFYPHKAKTPAEGMNENVLEIRAQPIKPEDIKITSQYIGFVTPINAVEVTSYISGYLDDIFVKGGEEVQVGDTLIVIKQDEYKANLALAKAQMMKAAANFENAKAYYNRIKQAGSKAISKTEYDSAKAQFLSSQAAVEEAKANYTLAKVNYDYTVIQAPISGIIGNVTLTKGDYVSPSSGSLVKLIQYNPIRVVFSITDKEYLDEVAQNPNNLFGGENIQIRMSNGKIFEPKGQFKFMGNELNRDTNSLAVYADFENTGKTLIANAYVDVLIDRVFKDGVLIKQSMVSLSPEGNYIYTVNEGKLNKTVVDIVASKDNDYLLRNTFKSGDMLVMDKIGRINPEQKIRVKVINDHPTEGEKK